MRIYRLVARGFRTVQRIGPVSQKRIAVIGSFRAYSGGKTGRFDWLRDEPILADDGRVALCSIQNGELEDNILPPSEFQSRADRLRKYMADNEIGASIFTSYHNIGYFTGYIHYAWARNYACVITQDGVTTLSARVNGGKVWRRAFGDNLVYTDWTKDNFFRGIQRIIEDRNGKVAVEFDEISVENFAKIQSALPNRSIVDIGEPSMRMRMIKSAEEIKAIKNGTRVADIGGAAAVEALADGVPEYEMALRSTEAMTREIARTYPQSDMMDTFAWFQSGINTDNCHNSASSKRVRKGEILSLNCFPVIQGYYAALERNLFLDHVPDENLRIWEANVAVYKRGLELIKPGARCCDITMELNELYREKNLYQYRSFGYGHSLGVMSHYYGREGGMEFREDVTTVLQPNMVVTMEPMIMIPEGQPGAGGYREHDVVAVTETGSENLTNFPVGPENNVIKK